MANDQLSHFDLKGLEHGTSAVAGLLYGDSSRGVHIPNSGEVLKSILKKINESFDEIRNSENEDEYIVKVKTMISNIRETMNVYYKSGLIKEDDLDLVKKFIDEIEVSLDKSK